MLSLTIIGCDNEDANTTNGEDNTNIISNFLSDSCSIIVNIYNYSTF